MHTIDCSHMYQLPLLDQVCHHSCWKETDAPPPAVDSFWALRGQWFTKRPVVYQIFVGDQSYVGKAKSMRHRLNDHHKWAPKATSIQLLTVFWPGVSKEVLDMAEAYWIDRLQPELNIAPPNRRWSR